MTTTTTYIGPLIYESRQATPSDPNDYTDRLQFIFQEEGRIRPSSTGGNPAFVYDYFIKDHLGNVRMSLTEGSKLWKSKQQTKIQCQGGTEAGVQ